jgi:hypothetical protein
MSEANDERHAVAAMVLRVFGRDRAKQTLASWRSIADSCEARSTEAALRGEGHLERILRRQAGEWRADAQALAGELDV